MITKVFSPTRTKILGKYGVLRRSEGYTTNGYIAFLSSFEPDWMSELKESEGSSPKIKRLFDEYSSKELIELKITDELSLSGNSVFIKLKNDELVRWVNIWFLSFFLRLKYNLSFFTSKDVNSIVIKWEEDIVGIIMGVQHD